MSERKRVCLGAFAGAHGVKGETKIRAFTADAENVAAYGAVETEDGKRSFTLEVIRILKPNLVLARAPQIESREDAEALKGERFYVDRTALPPPTEGEYYVEDLVGLEAYTDDGGAAGRVIAVHNFGAGDILEIEGAPGFKGPLMIAFTKEFVPVLDLAAGRLTIAPEAIESAGGAPEGRG